MSKSDSSHPDSSSPISSEPSPSVTKDVEVSSTELLLSLTGPRNERLRVLEKEGGISLGIRGNTIRLQGPSQAIHQAERVLRELFDVMERGATVTEHDMLRSFRILKQNPQIKLRELFEHVVVKTNHGKQITPKGLAQKFYVQAIRDFDVVFGVGPAGTGKTYLAMAMAVAALQQRMVTRIILTRPAVEAGEKLGFLPGDLAEKVDPYLRPLYDALHDMMPTDKAHSLIQRGIIEVAPLAFMRGRTLSDSFVILDEAQNTTIAQMKMFLTRLGMRSKTVITGDITQADLPRGVSSGMIDALQLLNKIEGIQYCYFTDADVVRHPLVQRIIEAYDSRRNSNEEDPGPDDDAANE